MRECVQRYNVCTRGVCEGVCTRYSVFASGVGTRGVYGRGCVVCVRECAHKGCVYEGLCCACEGVCREGVCTNV